MLTKSINYWSFPGGLAGIPAVADVFRDARKAGFDAVEVCLGDAGDVSTSMTQADAKRVVQCAADEGIQIASVACGLFWGKSLTASDPAVRAEALQIGSKLIEVAAWLDAGAVLLIPGAVDVFFDPTAEVIPVDTVYARATDAVGALKPQAEAAGIAICIEQVWNKFLTGPVELAVFVDQFNSPCVGVYLDTGNCMPFGYPEQWIRYLGSRVKRVHFKDYRRAIGTAEGFVDLLAGDVNWPEVVRALGEIGYDGPVTAEMIPGYRHYPEVLIANTSRAMDAILGRNPSI